MFIKLWRGKGVYSDEKGKFLLWLFMIIRNIVIDIVRKRKNDFIFLEEIFDFIEDDYF